VVVGIPTGCGPTSVTLTTYRHETGGLVADVALVVRIDQVLRGHLEQARGMTEVVPVTGAVQGEDGIGGPARLKGGPTQGHRVGGVVALGGVLSDLAQVLPGLCVRQDRDVVGGTDGDVHVVATGDRDGVLDDLQGTLLTVHHVVFALYLFQVEVHDIRVEVGEPPRDGLVLADDHAGQPGEAESADVEGAFLGQFGAVQAHLVPGGGHGGTQVGVVGQQGCAGVGVLTRDHPGVGTQICAAGGAEEVGDVLVCSGQVFECVEGFLRQVGGGGQVRLGIGIGAVVLVGAGDGGVLLRRVGRVQLLDLFLIESVGEQLGAGGLLLEVATQVPGHGLEPGKAVGGGPGFDGVVVGGDAQ